MKHYEFIRQALKEGYKVTSTGEVIGKRGRVLKKMVSNSGYYYINPKVSGRMRSILVHQIVFVATIGKNVKQIKHIDGNKLNNQPGNLEESNRSHNMRHAYRTGLVVAASKEAHGMSKLTAADVKKIRLMYASGKYLQREIAESFGVCRQSVGYIVNPKLWNI